MKCWKHFHSLWMVCRLQSTCFERKVIYTESNSQLSFISSTFNMSWSKVSVITNSKAERKFLEQVGPWENPTQMERANVDVWLFNQWSQIRYLHCCSFHLVHISDSVWHMSLPIDQFLPFYLPVIEGMSGSN